MKVNPIVPVLFLTFFIFACSNRPSHVLSEKKMEKVLYDIYLADAEISLNYTIFSSDSTRRKELLNSVLKKHKITEAVLDTSLAWYAGHLNTYFRINKNLEKRFAEAVEKLKSTEETTTKLFVNTDNFILPVEKERFLIQSGKVHTFKADTTLNRYGGAYELQFNVLGLSASLHPVVTLCVQCLDTIFVKRETIRQNGFFVTSVDIQQGKQAQKLFGSVYFPEVYSGITVFIQDFTLSYSFQSGSRDLSVAQPAK